ncbi:hypothetical protein HPB47_020873 [Ixodes persulcatus]|uniref:Uncharacterized protein n=1 Tax=Ixodes persulcatus TaxID=34615 RepID=A0AC60QE65_IXOPE|nr:hypothetical protein HPB47_020873 [Ixodes persulcatus]
MKTNRVPYLNEDYDYESIMHYFFNAFSKDPEQATLVPRNRGIELFNLGLAFKENRMTKVDIHKLNTIYKCPVDTGPHTNDGNRVKETDHFRLN